MYHNLGPWGGVGIWSALHEPLLVVMVQFASALSTSIPECLTEIYESMSQSREDGCASLDTGLEALHEQEVGPS